VDATTFTISIVSRGSTIRFLLTCWFIKAKLALYFPNPTREDALPAPDDQHRNLSPPYHLIGDASDKQSI